MIVGIHQPNFFPWLGFFDKMCKCDLFILLDTVQFIKRGYQNRVQLKYPNGAQWFTLPVITKGRWKQATRDVEIDPSPRWRRIHIQTFDALYRKTPHYPALIDELSTLYENPTSRLAEFNILGVKWVKKTVGIETHLALASELGKYSSSGSALLLHLVKAVGGTVYLSGPTGRNYLDEALFSKAGIKVDYHSFTPFNYPQRFGEFIPGLSVLDYLFNVGPGFWR
jgi:WbqC-like protein family